MYVKGHGGQFYEGVGSEELSLEEQQKSEETGWVGFVVYLQCSFFFDSVCLGVGRVMTRVKKCYVGGWVCSFLTRIGHLFVGKQPFRFPLQQFFRPLVPTKKKRFIWIGEHFTS